MGIDERINAAIEREAEEEGKKAFLKELIINDQLRGAALGSAKQMIARGEDSLSPAQKEALERDAYRPFDEPCPGCGVDIQWDEKYEASHRDGYCSWCHDRMTNPPD